MGAEQRRAALRVMTPCQFSVIFVDLQERPSLGETPFRLDISGVLRWFEMEKICRNLTWCIQTSSKSELAGDGSGVEVRQGGQAADDGLTSYDQLQSRAAERRGTPPVWWPHAEDVRWQSTDLGLWLFFPSHHFFVTRTEPPCLLSLPWRGHDCERRLERHAPQPTQSVGRGDTAERRHHAPPRADVVRRFDATACGCWTHASVLAHWRASAAPQHEPANLIVGRRSSYIIIIIIGAIVFFFS